MANPLLDGLLYVGEALDKPGRAVRGVLAGRGHEGLAAVPFSDSLGLTDPADAVSGRQLVNQYGLSTGSDAGDAALGVGADMLLDPTTYLGVGGVGRILGQGAKAAGDAGRVGLKGLRGRFPVLIDDAAGGRQVGGARLGDAGAILGDFRRQGAFEGTWNPIKQFGVVADTRRAPLVRRHETMHGLVDQARQTGDASSLGLVGRAAARLPSTLDGSAPGWQRALGLVADETAAHMAEGRGLLGQLAQGSRFFTQPHRVAFYGDQLEQLSPLVAALYRNARYAPAAGLAGLGGVGAGVAGAMSN